MLEFPTWKRVILWFMTLAFTFAAVPSMANLAGLSWPSFLPSPTINLGLDLAGGSHMLLEAQRSQVAKTQLDSMEESVRTALSHAKPPIAISDFSRSGDSFSFIVKDPKQVDAAQALIEPMTKGAGYTGHRDWTIQVDSGDRIVLTETQAGLDIKMDQAMNSATDVVRRRIDALGTREPDIRRQGSNRIVVEVPGLTNPKQLKELLGKTAKLEFKLVDTKALPSDVAKGIANPGSELVPGAPGSDYAGQMIAVKRLGGIRGDSLVNAQQAFDQRTNEPVVNITFNSQAAARWARITTNNVGKQFAIILDGKVISAPRINEPILSPTSQISGGFTVQSANQLAIALRSGALPVNLTVIEERTVGPELGADSIRSGLTAMAIGSLLVVVLMIASYGRFGIYATIALVFNILMILGIMALIGSTLTLPGIAGLVLTIGAAVDANVLINERIREERKRGRKVIASVENGYREASRAIWDANITNVIAAIVLASIAGSGPVRGFAIVLIIGIATTIFTAVYLTRMWVALWLRKARPSDLNL